jgi:uncharacterized membrane protein
VTLKRLAAARRVFILGMTKLLEKFAGSATKPSTRLIRTESAYHAFFPHDPQVFFLVNMMYIAWHNNTQECPMPKITGTGLKWLKFCHLIAVACWLGGGISLLSLALIPMHVTDGGQLYGINQSFHRIDMAVVVIMGACGCFVTGLLYSAVTPWGFVKHRWITVKWLVTVSAVLFGTVCLGPWETLLMDMAGAFGLEAPHMPKYQLTRTLSQVFGTVQILILFLTVWISVFKPWKNTKRTGSSKA